MRTKPYTEKGIRRISGRYALTGISTGLYAASAILS
jgi:hypothetical protein